jgi:ABC-type nitrate/sulfonate/bicarbonate transport system ATPase subunit
LMAERVLIMSQNPGRIVNELEVDLGWPRRHADPTFQKLRDQLMQMFVDTDADDSQVILPSNIHKNNAQTA